MANNIIVQDVAEVYLKDLSDSSVYFFGLTTKSDVQQKIKQDFMRGGIGNGIAGVIQSEKEITFSVTTLFHADDMIAIQSGSAIQTNQSVTVMKSETLKLATNKLTLVGTPKTGTTTVTVLDSTGKSYAGTFATGQVTVTGGTDGNWYTVLYPADVTASAISLDSKKFPHNYTVELHTIGYNPDTNAVACDIWWQFAKALPDGTLNESMEAGKSSSSEVKFVAQLPQGASEYGKYLVVPRP